MERESEFIRVVDGASRACIGESWWQSNLSLELKACKCANFLLDDHRSSEKADCRLFDISACGLESQ